MNKAHESRAMALFELALDQPSDERHAWVVAQTAGGTEGDEAVRQRVLSLLRADTSAASAMPTGGAPQTLAPMPMPERIGAYRITRLIGQGGMGAVYEAARDAGDFEHIAAIKVIRPGVMSDVLEGRFREERQVLAGLNHPHIARLFDGGETEDGTPYIVMEYVAGSPILDHVAQAGLDLKARVALICDVCAAVRYAHQNLIIHRDITPNNVLVTRDGTAKLIDFGISRLSEDPASSSKAPGISLSFTPGYAAPERSTGTVSTTLTDIYSLGRLLTDLMDGQPPSMDLAAIAARAGAYDADDRYNSVDALLDDLERWSDGRPVSARGAGASYRFGKYIRRRKGIVAGITAAFVALAAALTITYGQYREAEAARAIAQERFTDLRAFARTMLTDVYAEIDRVPGSTAARRGLAEATQVYLDKMASTPGAPRDLRLETADGFTRLGLIYNSPKGFSLEMPQEGKAAFDKARAILDAELALTPDEPELLLLAAKHYFYEAEPLINPLNDWDGALLLLDKSEALLRRRIEILGEGDEAGRISLLYTLGSRGEAVMAQNRLDEAIAIYETIIAESEALIAARAARGEPPEEGLLRLNNSAYRVLGQALTYEERYPEAIAALDRAIELYPAIEAIRPNDNFAIRGKSLAYGRRAYVLGLTGEYDRALEDYQYAIALSQKRIDADPLDADAMRMLVIHKGEMAAALGGLGRHEEAGRLLLDAMEYHQDMLAASPDMPALQRNVWVQHYLLALHFRRAGDEAAACASYRDMALSTAARKAAGTLGDADSEGWAEVLVEFANCDA